MAIDFTEIDSVITLLQKKSIGGGSPPVVEHGYLGLWRTVRGFRMFLELQPGTGKWAVNVKGKPHTQGRVLVGPPSLVNKPIGGLPDDTWGQLSGSGTKEAFSSATPGGLVALQTGVKNSLKDDDTRIPALAAADLPKTVQIARSAGFTDDEIKQALGGKIFENAIEDKPSNEDNVIPFKRPSKPTGDEDNVVPFPRPGKPDAEDKPDGPRPTSPSPERGQMTADGAFAPLLEALSRPAQDGEDANEVASAALDDAAKQIKEEFLARQIRALAAGLRTGDFKLDQVRAEVAQLIEHRKARLLAQMEPEDMARLDDKAAAKAAVAEIKQHNANAATVTPEQILANAQFYHDQIMALSQQVSDPKVKQQLIVLARKVKQHRLGGNSVVLRVLAILRLILAFIPGVG